MSSNASPSIAVVLCSSRSPRACPQIADLVVDSMKQPALTSKVLQHDGPPPSDPQAPPVQFNILDLVEINLPMFNETTIPQQVTNPEDYGQPHTRSWSKEVQKHSAFVFVLPQYNWGYPAIVKNAIDYLYSEWNAKPAMIVSYGSKGGTLSAQQLRQVLQAVKMNVVETMPALAFPGRPTTIKAASGQDIGLMSDKSIWATERKDVQKGFGEIMDLVNKLGA